MSQLVRSEAQLGRTPLNHAVRAVLAEHERELASPYCAEICTSFELDREETALFGLIRYRATYGFTIRSKNG